LQRFLSGGGQRRADFVVGAHDHIAGVSAADSAHQAFALLLSPATVFLSRGGFSQIPPLVGDEDLDLWLEKI